MIDAGVPVLDLGAAAGEPEPSASLLPELLAQVRARTGRDFGAYKPASVLRRIRHRMHRHHVEDLAAYLELLRADGDEAAALGDELLVTVTGFFRDGGPFGYLETTVLPRLLEAKGAQDPVRAWSAGCASGEEAYTLAMLLLEAVEGRPKPPPLQVFATDLHDGALRHGREGLYPRAMEADVCPERRERWFVRVGARYRIRTAVRQAVLFCRHDLLRDPPFGHIDLIACRNLLIYLQRRVQPEVVSLLHFALSPGGYLLLGNAETIDAPELFALESKEHHLYRRRDLRGRRPGLPRPSLSPG